MKIKRLGIVIYNLKKIIERLHNLWNIGNNNYLFSHFYCNIFVVIVVEELL